MYSITKTQQFDQNDIQSTSETGKIRVLIVDDEASMLNLLERTLQSMGFDTTPADNGAYALQLIFEHAFDLVLLDVVMPESNGFDICRKVRQFSNVPIIMLTALNRPEDIVKGFELGADSYIVKPFVFKEMEARITALLRRTCSANHRNQALRVIRVGDIVLDNRARRVTIENQMIDLTSIEFDLLGYLMRFTNQPVSKSELLENVWRYSSNENENLVESAIRRLRRKIEDDPSQPQRLLTIRSFGYKITSMKQIDSEQAKPKHLVPTPASLPHGRIELERTLSTTLWTTSEKQSTNIPALL